MKNYKSVDNSPTTTKTNVMLGTVNLPAQRGV